MIRPAATLVKGAATGKEVTALRGHEDWVNSAQFSPDGKQIVTASLDKTARVWEVATGKPTESVRFYKVDGDGSSLKGQRKFDPQFRNDFPDLLAKWPTRAEEPGRAWCVSAENLQK